VAFEKAKKHHTGYLWTYQKRSLKNFEQAAGLGKAGRKPAHREHGTPDATGRALSDRHPTAWTFCKNKMALQLKSTICVAKIQKNQTHSRGACSHTIWQKSFAIAG
jgi:hypothetical protein